MKTITINSHIYQIDTLGNDIILISHEKDIYIEGGHRALEKEAEEATQYAVHDYDDEGNSETNFQTDSDMVNDYIQDRIVEYCQENWKNGIVTINS